MAWPRKGRVPTRSFAAHRNKICSPTPLPRHTTGYTWAWAYMGPYGAHGVWRLSGRAVEAARSKRAAIRGSAQSPFARTSRHRSPPPALPEGALVVGPSQAPRRTTTARGRPACAQRGSANENAQPSRLSLHGPRRRAAEPRKKQRQRTPPGSPRDPPGDAQGCPRTPKGPPRTAKNRPRAPRGAPGHPGDAPGPTRTPN